MPMAPLCVNKKAAMRKRAHPRASVGSPLLGEHCRVQAGVIVHGTLLNPQRLHGLLHNSLNTKCYKGDGMAVGCLNCQRRRNSNLRRAWKRE